MYIIKLEKYMKCLSIVYRWWLQWLDKLNNAVLLQLELDRSAKHFSRLVTRYELRYSRNCEVRKSLLQRFFGRTLQFTDLENTAKARVPLTKVKKRQEKTHCLLLVFSWRDVVFSWLFLTFYASLSCACLLLQHASE